MNNDTAVAEAPGAVAPDKAAARRARINGTVLFIAPLVAGAVMLAMLGAPLWLPLGLGAAGWLLALLLRQPVALISLKAFGRDRTATIVGWFSGPAEELVRLALVLFALGTVQDALWAGFGWATIEVILVAVNAFAVASLLGKDDPKSIEARELLAAQGMASPPHFAWGLLERFGATAMHIGFTLMLFANPWLVLVTLPVHSLTNMAMVRFAKTSLPAAETVFALISAATLAAGILLAL